MHELKKKNILNIGFLVLLLVLTFWLVFRDQDLGPIVEILGKVPIHFIFIGLVLVVCYVCGESVIIKYLLHAVKIKAPLINCIRYSFVGSFSLHHPIRHRRTARSDILHAAPEN